MSALVCMHVAVCVCGDSYKNKRQAVKQKQHFSQYRSGQPPKQQPITVNRIECGVT